MSTVKLVPRVTRRRRQNGSTECSRCSAPRDVDGQRYCRACHATYVRTHRRKYADLTPVERVKNIARAYANVYVRAGRIERKPCESCGDQDAEMHHEDYTEPLQVLWLCRKCHVTLHAEGR